MKYFYLLTLVGLIHNISWGQATPNFWKPIKGTTNLTHSNTEVNIQGSHQLLELDLEGIRDYLLNAPKENTEATQSNPLLLSLPLPNGAFEAFEIVETSVMAPGLAAKYPMIKAYKGISKSRRSTNVRLDISPKGFFASIFAIDGYKYIERIEDANPLYYRVYNIKNLQVTNAAIPALSCGVNDMSDIIDSNHKQTFGPTRNKELEARNNTPMLKRKYRLALACTGEYAQQKGGTVEAVLASMNSAMNVVNQIFLLETGVELEIIENNDVLIFLDPTTDPYAIGNNGEYLVGINTDVINFYLGESFYDLGHVFTSGCTDVGGIAGGRPCAPSKGAGVTCHSSNNVNFIALEIMAHEIGHQFSAAHSWNNCPGSQDQFAFGDGFEPGSGSTIMSYSGACGSENNVQFFSDPYYNIGSLEDFISYSREGNGSTCATEITTSNNNPTVTLDYEDGFFIPQNTPFELIANGSDPDGDEITYCWEQYNVGPSSTLGDPIANAPSFRSILPSTAPNRVFPRLEDLVQNISRATEVLPVYQRDLNFRCTVRDNNPEAGGAVWEEVAFKTRGLQDPFVVTYPTESNISWEVGSYQEVQWDVANTNLDPINCRSVNIRLSLDGGLTYPLMLLEGTLNDGTAFITVPNNLTDQARIRVDAADNIFFNISREDFEITPPSEPSINVNIASEYALVCLPDQVEFELSTSSILGQEGAIELAIVTELQEGFSGSFSDQSIISGSSSTLIFDLDNTIESGTYPIEIQASSGGTVIWNRTINLDVNSTAFDDLNLLSPEDGTTNVVLSTEFNWSESINADLYTIEIATSPGFEETVILTNGQGPDLNFASEFQFDNNILYFWRVIPYNLCGPGEPTLPFGFHTQTISCNRYENTDPVFISGTGLPTRESSIFVEEDGIISDINIDEIIGSYQPVNSIRMSLVSPASTEVVLFDQNCGTTANFRLGFDDESPSEIICPPDDRFVLQPVEPLATFIGESTFGTWILRWQVVDPGFGGGGAIDSWNIEFCATLTPENPTLITNNPITVNFASAEDIRQEDLEVQDEASSADQLTYTLVTLPAYGQLFLAGQALGIGSQFSQTDINNLLFNYQHDGTVVERDDFLFVVQDGEGGWIPNQQFNINIDLSTSTAEILTEQDIQIYPNPTNGVVSVSFQEAINEPLHINILNIQGQQVLNNQLGKNQQQFELDLNDLPNGVYILTFQTTDVTVSKKLIIQR